MRESAIADYHRQHAKELITIGDLAVPISYRLPDDEFLAAMNGPVLIDRSYLGVARVFGKDAGGLLHRLTTNEMRHLQVGQSVVNIFATAKGRILDVVQMLRREEDYLLITSPARTATVLQWIDKYTFVEDVRREDLTKTYALFSIFGKAPKNLAGLSLDEFSPQRFRVVRIGGAEAILHHTDGIAPNGFNLIVNVEAARAVWDFLLHHAQPIGFSAYNALRVHDGIPAVDAEISEHYNPHEVGLLPFIDFEKGCYIGQEVIARLDTYDKVQRRLVGLEFENERVPTLNNPLWANAEEAGVLTSAVFSPLRRKAIGLGLVRRAYAEAGQSLSVPHGGATWPCVTVHLPFI